MPRAWVLSLSLAVVVAMLGPASALAQGLASGLGDPSGGRAAPSRQTRVEREPRAAEPDSVPASPAGYGSDEVVPPPPGGAYASPGAPSSPSSSATLTRMRALDASLTALAASGGPDYVGVALSLIGGGVSIAFGVISLELGDPFARMAPYLMVLGGTSILRTVMGEFILRPDTRGYALEYHGMRQGTDAERRARIEYGEHALEAIAEASMIARIVDGAISIAGALAIVPAYLAPNDFMIVDGLEALVFIGPAISLITGIITLASPSSAEQRWDAYRELRDRLGARAAMEQLRERAEAPSVDFGVSAGPNGGMAVANGRF